MNEFIEITNRIIKEKLKDKINISSIDYYILDGILKIKVSFYTNDFEKKGFTYCCNGNFDKDLLEMDFKCFINRNFKVNN